MTDYENMKHATRREWAAAKVVVIGGLIFAVAIAVFFAWKTKHDAAVEQEQAQQQAQQQAKQQQQQELKAIGATICEVQLIEGKLLGIVPRYAQITTKMPMKTATPGRYACEAATQVSQYRITADLLCRDIAHTKCTRIVSIQFDDGTILYKAK